MPFAFYRAHSCPAAFASVATVALLFSAVGACSKTDSPAKDNAAPAASASAASSAGSGTAALNPALNDPSLATETAPATYKAKFVTSKGDFTIEVTRSFAPKGADRFYNLVKIGYYDNDRFFRVVSDFMVQFGIHGAPDVNARWKNARIADDEVTQSNKRGFVTFATSGKDSRTTQIFINFVDGNARLDGMGFAPFGRVIEGMDVVDNLYKGYGEGAPSGRGPNQARIQAEGNAYLTASFPQLDYVKEAHIVP